MTYVHWGGESCIILHRIARSRGYKRVRDGGDPRSQDVSGVCVFASFSLGTVPARSFYSFKEVYGYKMFVDGVILVGEGA
jgi:hypothetical protein